VFFPLLLRDSVLEMESGESKREGEEKGKRKGGRERGKKGEWRSSECVI